jgi:hypothetical protein
MITHTVQAIKESEYEPAGSDLKSNIYCDIAMYMSIVQYFSKLQSDFFILI